MNRKNSLYFFLAATILMCAGCSTGNTSGGKQTEAVKPAPQVRVEAMPSATATLPLPVDETVPATIEPTATLSQVYILPTPDEDAIVNQIDGMMDDIDKKLRNQDFLLKP